MALPAACQGEMSPPVPAGPGDTLMLLGLGPASDITTCDWGRNTYHVNTPASLLRAQCCLILHWVDIAGLCVLTATDVSAQTTAVDKHTHMCLHQPTQLPTAEADMVTVKQFCDVRRPRGLLLLQPASPTS
jgi:hypothetical protein